ncbi:MAG: glycoside hydrolase family 32 protein [Clostridia bacterium]|nr:glycoside hydrolase family 32 protein [Clostridia bacterium]
MFDLKIDKRYVTFESDPKNKNCVAVNFFLDGNTVEQIFTHLGENPSGYKYFVDMSEFKGKTLQVEIAPSPSQWKRMPEGDLELTPEDYDKLGSLVRVEDDFEDAPHYGEHLRPLVHFTTLRGWINDPNGLIYHDGKYHMYYQHCPGATYGMWDNNHWGHAVSDDLFNWTELEPVMRYPHRASGTGFHDRKTGKPCVACDYLIFESDDGGYHYKFKSVNNAGSGDPKILFHEESGRYISITLRDITSYSFSSSEDLENWVHESDIEQFRECPDMVKYKIEGTDEEKWVLNGGDGAYMIGQFDGHKFTPDEIDESRLDKYVNMLEATKDFSCKYNGAFVNTSLDDPWERFSAYAFQNFDSAPDGRKIRIAWYAVGFEQFGMPFTQAMTIPQELKLRRTGFGVRLCAMPVCEIEGYYEETRDIEGDGVGVVFEEGRAFDTEIETDVASFVKIGGYGISYNEREKKLHIIPDGEKEFTLPLVPIDGKIRIRAIFDVMMCEFFFGVGEVYCPLKLKKPANDGLYINISGNGRIRASKLKRSIK